MNLSRDKYTLTIHDPIPVIKERLCMNTLNRPRLIKEKTYKLLIGEVKMDGFSLIGSSPIGVLCALNGTFEYVDGKTTTVEIETKIQKVFILLFTAWIIIIGVLMLVAYIIDPGSGPSIFRLLLILIATVCFRLFLHLMYIRSRNLAIYTIKNIME
jgi:hypothetical protein